MSKKVVITEEKLVDLIYSIVESSLKELKSKPIGSDKKVVKEAVKPTKKVVKRNITEEKLVELIDKIVKQQIAEKGKN